MQQQADRFEAAVRVVEATRGELLDEGAFMRSFLDNWQAAINEVQENPFLESLGIFYPSERQQLTDEINTAYHDVLRGLSETLSRLSTHEDLAQVQFEIDESVREAQQFMLDFQRRLFSSLDRAALSGGTIFDGEFQSIVEGLPEVNANRAENEYRNVDAADIPQLSSPETEDRVIYQTNIGGTDCFLQIQTDGSYLFFFPAQNGEPLSLTAAQVSPLSVLEDTINQHLRQQDQIPLLVSASIESSLTDTQGLLTPLPDTLWEEQNEFSPDSHLALDSAYNMGVRAALQAKAQFLTARLAQSLNLETTLELDGSFGPQSQEVLQAVFQAHNIPYTGQFNTDLEALRTLYAQEFGENPTLFLTADEINHPDYEFSNRGVFRGLRVTQLNQVFAQRGLNQDALNYLEQELGINLTRRFQRHFPAVVQTLDRLNIPPEIQYRIVATTLLETGLSQADIFGVDVVGRGDKKATLQYLSTRAPRLTALGANRLSITSAGETQINYRTAQAIIAEHTGTVLSRPQILELLEDNLQFSVLMTVLVYYDNQEQITQLNARFNAS